MRRLEHEVHALLKEAVSVEEAATFSVEALKNKLRKIVGVESEERSVGDRIEVDSLLGLELRDWLLQDVWADMAVFKILGDTKLANIGLLAAKKFLLTRREGKDA
jgi:hypothetical protein